MKSSVLERNAYGLFYDSFSTELDALVKRYEMGDEDKAWLCAYKLKQYGIDIAEWNEEVRE